MQEKSASNARLLSVHNRMLHCRSLAHAIFLESRFGSLRISLSRVIRSACASMLRSIFQENQKENLTIQFNCSKQRNSWYCAKRRPGEARRGQEKP